MIFGRSKRFDRSDFPDSWAEEDFEVLAEISRVEFNAEFVEALNDPDGYDYYLFVEEDESE
jgi:hypothetical protein